MTLKKKKEFNPLNMYTHSSYDKSPIKEI